MSRVKTDCTLQFEVTECGAAALCTVLKYYGKYVSLAELRSTCKVGRDGISMKKIAVGSEKYGLISKAFKRDRRFLESESASLPCILWWDKNHFVVFEGIENGYAYIANPANGRERLTLQEFDEHYSGFCLELKKTDSFVEGGEKPNPYRIIVPFCKRYFLLLTCTFLFGLLTAVPVVIYAGASQEFVNEFLEQGRIYFGLPIIWILSLAVLLDAFLSWISLILFRRLQIVFSRDSSLSVFSRILSLDYKYFSQRIVGELANRISVSLELPNILINQVLAFLVGMGRSLIIFVVAFIISPWLVLLVLATICLNLGVSYVILSLQKDDIRVRALSDGEAQGVSMQAINQIEIIKGNSSEFTLLGYWQESFTKVVRENQIIGYLNAYSSTTSNASTFLLKILTLIIGGILIIEGNLSLGQLVAFQLLEGQISAPIKLIPTITSQYQQLTGLISRIADVFDGPIDPYLGLASVSNAGLKHSAPIGQIIKKDAAIPNLNAITFDSVSFSYDGSDNYLIKDVSFELTSGKHYAFVGTSGCGKSTVIRLLVGLIVPNVGDIKYDDKDWIEFGTNNLRNAIKYVPQEPFMFNASIKQNISMFDPDYSDSDIWEALRLANIDREVGAYPDGIYHHIRDNGSDLSGGQRQRLELARAILRKPKLLILDEATSSLDVDSERRVLSNLLQSGTTVVSAAHRLTSAIKSDFVYVFDQGSLIENGSPSSLLENKDSIFSELYASEFGGASK